MNSPKKTLLAVVEQGGYPDFTRIYEDAGYQVEMLKTTRKAIGFLKKIKLISWWLNLISRQIFVIDAVHSNQ